jgi:hypothetical protein
MPPSGSSQPARALAGFAEDAVRGTSADPWDAPYFGAPVYLAYRAVRPGAVDGASPRITDEWVRFPFLGGPVYDGFPPFEPGAHAAPTGEGTPALTGPALDTLNPPFFGAPVHLAYEPGIAAFASDFVSPFGTTGPHDTQPQAPAATGERTQRNERRNGWLARLLRRLG